MNTQAGARLGWAVGILLAASLACGSSGNTNTISRGDLQKFNQLGFSFAPPSGSKVGDLGILAAVVESPNVELTGKNDLGPVCTASTSNHPGLEIAKKDYWSTRAATIKTDYGLVLSAAQETTTAGQFAMVGEINGNYLTSMDPKGREAYGKLLVVSIDDRRVFDMACLGLVERKAEVSSMFDSLKGSLKFFDPVTPTAQP